MKLNRALAELLISFEGEKFSVAMSGDFPEKEIKGWVLAVSQELDLVAMESIGQLVLIQLSAIRVCRFCSSGTLKFGDYLIQELKKK